MRRSLGARGLGLAGLLVLACSSQPVVSEQQDADEPESWPQAKGEPLSEGTLLELHLTRSAISLRGRELLRLRAGELDPRDRSERSIPALAQVLADEPVLARPRGKPSSRPLVQVLVYADARTPFATLVEVVSTLRAAGVTRYAFAVESRAGVFTQIPARMPPLRVAQLPLGMNPEAPVSEALAHREAAQARLDAWVMSIELGEERMSMSVGRNATTPPIELGIESLDAVTRYAEELRARSPLSRQVLVSADPGVSCQTLLSTVVAARGPGCGQPEGACPLPEVILFPSSAHRRGPKGQTVLPPLPSLQERQ